MSLHVQAAATAFISALPGGGEILLLLLLILLLFGPRRLPEFARSIGRVMSELRRAAEEFKEQLMSAEHLLDDNDTRSGNNKEESSVPPNNDFNA